MVGRPCVSALVVEASGPPSVTGSGRRGGAFDEEAAAFPRLRCVPPEVDLYTSNMVAFQITISTRTTVVSARPLPVFLRQLSVTLLCLEQASTWQQCDLGLTLHVASKPGLGDLDGDFGITHPEAIFHPL